jgi:hypothetical protein
MSAITNSSSTGSAIGSLLRTILLFMEIAMFYTPIVMKPSSQ